MNIFLMATTENIMKHEIIYAKRRAVKTRLLSNTLTVFCKNCSLTEVLKKKSYVIQ